MSMFFNRKSNKQKDGIVSVEDAGGDVGLDFHVVTEQALRNVFIMAQTENASLSLEKIAMVIQQSFPKSTVQELIKILARNQSK